MDCCVHCTQVRCLVVFLVLFLWEYYFNVSVHRGVPYAGEKFHGVNSIATVCKNVDHNGTAVYYKYPLINSMEVAMDYENGYNSSYYWFMEMKHRFKKIGEERLRLSSNTPVCKLNNNSLGPIKVNKSEPKIDLIEQQNPDVKLGGYYAPAHCRSKHRVAVIVPYRDRRANLAILLSYLHPLLKKQLLEYRVFVIEQYGSEKFNKGTLYNIAFLETQRFGSWHCLIFHDVDLVPENERISYSCPEHPTHMSSAVESFGYTLPYKLIFGGVTALTPKQYRTVNGYSNFYWNWGGEDDDFYGRLQLNNYTVARYNSSIARYATLPHKGNEIGNERIMLLMISKLRSRKEGLTTTKYNILRVKEEKLYTHILADVNPKRMKLDTKSLMHNVLSLYGETIVYGQQEYRLADPAKL